MNVAGALTQHARRTPDRPAIACDGDQICWHALAQAAERIAAHLAATVPAGRGVALHLPNGPASALLFLAACRAGREAQILDPEWPLQTTRTVIAELRPGIVVTTDASLCYEPFWRIAPDVTFANVADAVAAPRTFSPAAEPDELQPFYVGFTSGSTGMPKGFRRHHRSWLASFGAGDLEFDIGPDDVVLAPGTLTHSLFLYALAHGLHVGATVVLSRQFKPTAVNRSIQAHGATVIYGVPAQIETMVDAAERIHASPFETVRWVLSSGAKWKTGLAERLRRQFPSARFAEFYGASELSFTTVAKDDEDVPPESVGRAFADVVITIRDHRGDLLAPGEAGLVFVESPFLFMNYACGSGAALPRVGNAVSVGDIGVLDARGFLRLVGRASRMIISAGKNVHPEEIERVLESHANVGAAAVLGVADALRGERLVALLRPRCGRVLERASLIAHARLSLPLHKVPRRYAVPHAWPMTRSGKTDFQALARLWADGAYEELT